jgi:hypothetical protein
MMTGGRGDALSFAFKMTGLVLTMLPHAYQQAKYRQHLRNRVRGKCPDYRLNINGDPIILH